ncbi:hypothetical protein AB0F81_37875 [Actinoplanes sp. NPDC024001]
MRGEKGAAEESAVARVLSEERDAGDGLRRHPKRATPVARPPAW